MKEALEKEIRELNNILFLATESFKIVEYLAKDESDDDKAYTKNMNAFLRYSMIINWRITVIELSKLLSGKDNDHYHLRKFINKLKPDGIFKSAEIPKEITSAWESKLSEEVYAIKNLVDQRDKLYAHTDRTAAAIKNAVTVSKAKELITFAQSIIKEIYSTIFKSGFSFDAFNSPVNNLEWIIDSLTDQKKEKYKALKALALEHGIIDEFK
jgi:hypothetical protein